MNARSRIQTTSWKNGHTRRILSTVPAVLNALYMKVVLKAYTTLQKRKMSTTIAKTRIQPEKISPARYPSHTGRNIVKTMRDKKKLISRIVFPRI